MRGSGRKHCEGGRQSALTALAIPSDTAESVGCRSPLDALERGTEATDPRSDQGARPGRAELARQPGISGRTCGSWFASCDLAQPTKVCTSTRGIQESGFIDELVRFVEHVFSGTPKPSRANMASPWSLVKLRDQEPSIGFQHAVHLSDSGRLVVLSHVVQSEGARDRVEGVIREREVLRERDLERCRHSAPARLATGAVDHLGCCINPVDRAGGCHPLCEDDRLAARAAAHIEDAVAWLELKIISQHAA